ncbi:hypothetical protein A3D00_04640 [Candidatus Woesebacteria bacterium RIFCSPHIGHO2_02_FULL_38_9]|uniref:M23ase beta-sheet core domain-containing protein n=1 Tax=Candidatus Woesebacteria bacterium RIFCSPHIGHO2_01_FULL_39_28 TaxID=1802496 RepID=A0A1F7YL38_9BACT|nr:MAG: hypothetical protein A2627_00470 [Candidatus Woesebacteria bacterium RIFCSPHIGHO2_01_FULL_39_28]OGM31914.1 MAG: hypothetical protein A3D00_04640 [Candidatus Woesebacteria bacterium RIFCSPHIGHO2_02_FULL_38_9]OGM56714.1 MAG: hypothetical protein A3A50_05150 [Candidatus Woesebacteria bacterium RIFCSPLOWO2_01_FULL_38_20]
MPKAGFFYWLPPMIKISLNLPVRYRLDLKLTKKRRGWHEESILPSLVKIRNARSGNKISRYFRHIFQHNKLKRILGSNLALAVFAGSYFTSVLKPPVFENASPDITFISDFKTSLITQKGVQTPLEKIIITQGFRLFHPGIDLSAPKGEPVRPMMAGKVEYTQQSKFDYGNAVIISHGNGLETLYAHLSKIDVGKNEEVSLNTNIGEVGATGHATGNHLHFEIRQNGLPINSTSILQLQ